MMRDETELPFRMKIAIDLYEKLDCQKYYNINTGQKLLRLKSFLI